MNFKHILLLACSLTSAYAFIDGDKLKEKAKTWNKNLLFQGNNNNDLLTNPSKYFHDDKGKLLKPKQFLKELSDFLFLGDLKNPVNEMIADFFVKLMVCEKVKGYRLSMKPADEDTKALMAPLFVLLGYTGHGDDDDISNRLKDIIEKARKKEVEDKALWSRHLDNVKNGLEVGINLSSVNELNDYVEGALSKDYLDKEFGIAKFGGKNVVHQILGAHGSGYLLDKYGDEFGAPPDIRYALSKIPAGCFDIIFSLVKKHFMAGDMHINQILEDIKNISNIQVDRIDKVVKTAKEELIKDNMSGEDIKHLLEGLSVIPVERLKDVAMAAKKFIRDDIDGYQIKTILEGLDHIPEDKWDECLGLINEILGKNPTSDQISNLFMKILQKKDNIPGYLGFTYRVYASPF